MPTINRKPLSTNEAWKGRRFKTDAYKSFERDVLFLLPQMKMPEKPYRLSLTFGLSNYASDIDNGIKQTTDVIAKKYGFNDKEIIKLEVTKVRAEKGREYFSFEIETA